MDKMQESIRKMVCELASILDGQVHSVWLYGSAVMDDFHPGWSDIDFLALSAGPITPAQADRLLTLRQTLSEAYPDDPYYACFEGVILPLQAYLNREDCRAVYWGTSGQRILSHWEPDAFAVFELSRYGKSVYGEADRSIFACPDRAALVAAVRRHYDSIRRYAVETGESLYSCGWLLDIARCVCTLRSGTVIAKTRAGEQALAERLFPDEAELEKTLKIRKNPMKYKEDPETRAWLSGLGPVVQRCADVLEKELEKERL